MKVTEKALAQLRAKGDKRLLTTDEARTLTGVSVQQWQRLARMREFPMRTHVGRLWCVNANELAGFFEKRNRVAEGLTLTQAAELCRTTTYTLRDLSENGRFVDPIGQVNGHPRFARADVEAWQSQRLGGLDAPAPRKAGKKKI